MFDHFLSRRAHREKKSSMIAEIFILDFLFFAILGKRDLFSSLIDIFLKLSNSIFDLHCRTVKMGNSCMSQPDVSLQPTDQF